MNDEDRNNPPPARGGFPPSIATTGAPYDQGPTNPATHPHPEPRRLTPGETLHATVEAFTRQAEKNARAAREFLMAWKTYRNQMTHACAIGGRPPFVGFCGACQMEHNASALARELGEPWP